MAIKLVSITIDNFKSFKGKHTIGIFDNHLTAIVGPNGSGKSNLIDSILFVLGFKARRMRHSSMRALISNGCSDCSVELNFQQFTVCRSLKTRNSGVISLYYLNGAEISIGDLCNFLGEHGIDLETNRFLILQGEVENIAMLGAKELLGYIEECIGTAGLKTRISAIADEIKDQEEKRAISEHTLRFVENDYNFKKAQHDEHISDLTMQHELLGMKRRVIRMKHEIAQRRELQAEEKSRELRQDLHKVQEITSIQGQRLKELSTKVDSLQLHRQEEAVLQLKAAYQRYDRESNRVKREMERMEREISALGAKITEEEQKKNEWESMARSWEEQLANNKKEMKTLSEDLKHHEARLAAFQEVEKAIQTKAENESRLLKLLKQRDVITREEQNLAYLREKISALENTIKSQPKIETNRTRLNELTKDLKATQAEIARRKRSADDYRAVEKAYKHEQDVLTAIRNIPGVHGQLRSLGTVENGYETAMDAAARGMNSIVVNTTAVAEECIRVISKKRLARTTFVILDKLTKNVPQLTEKMLCFHMRCMPEHLPAFYYSIGDTLVSENMEEARKLAFGRQRRRVVTLNGQVLERSGIMSGGKVQKRAKSVVELEQVYEKMKAMHEEMSLKAEEAAVAERAIRANMAQLAQLKRELSQKENLSPATRSAGALDEEIARIKAVVASCGASSLPEEAQVLFEQIKAFNLRIAGLDKASRELESCLSNRPGCATSRAHLSSLQEELRNIQLPDAPVISGQLLIYYNLLSGNCLNTAQSGLTQGGHVPKDLSKEELRRMEDLYTATFKRFKNLQDEIIKVKEEMGSEFHREAEVRNRLDETEEALGESRKIKRNCAEKDEIVEKELSCLNKLLESTENSLPEPIEDPLEEMTEKELRRASKEIISEMESKEVAHYGSESKGANDPMLFVKAFASFREAQENYRNAKGQHGLISEQIKKLRKEHDEMIAQRTKIFMDGLTAINKRLKEIFAEITFGGNAELELVDFLDPFGEGVQLMVMPPKKTWKRVASLSGGEKTLSSLSLIFALHSHRASPVYIMDEIDAALDHQNVSVIAQYLKRIQSQFIVISLRSNMFESANKLLGVYKTKHISHAFIIDASKIKL